MRTVTLRTWTFCLLGAGVTAAAFFGGVSVWNASRELELTRTEAEALLAGFDTDAAITSAEYALITQLAAAPAEVRIEAARLSQEARYAPLLEVSAESLARALAGADLDGAVSMRLAEELLCTPLRNAQATANDDVPVYLVPALNPAALGSHDCATILAERLIGADPGSFVEGAQLLARVLDALPAAAARTHVARLAAQVAAAAPGSVDVLFSALRHVDSAEYPAEFAQATRSLVARFDTAPSATEVAALADAIDFLKYSVTADELVPVLDAAIGQMLVRDDRDLTHALFFTFTDLKLSHPETSFGARADYLLRGINVYSDAIEIYDYSRVLHLNEQHREDDAAIARAVLEGIRNLAPEDYLSGIVPYCKRFLETGAALDHAEFLDGAKLLVNQLNNDAFIFQRPCLLDSGLVARIDAADRSTVANLVIDALQNMDESAPRRIAEGVELLGMLTSESGAEPLARLADLIITATEASDAHSFDALVRAVGGADLAFPAEFYPELFVLVANRSDTGVLPLVLLDKLPEAQRSVVISNMVTALSAELDPETLAAQALQLIALRDRFSEEDKARIRAVLTAAMEDPRMLPVFNRLASALVGLRIDFQRERAAVQATWLRHVANSEARAELAPLFRSSTVLGAIAAADTGERATVRAALVRFLSQIVPGDEHAAAARDILQKPPEAPAQPEQRIGRTRTVRNTTRILLDMTDIDSVSGRYIGALAGERPIADFALSIQTLAQGAPPGALDNLLYALRQRLDASADPLSHEALVVAWMAVERSTNARRVPAERVLLYKEILQFPLTNAASQVRLTEEAGKIAQVDFAGNWRNVLAWLPADASTP